MAANAGATRDADTARERAMGADSHVVGDLNLIVQLDPLLDHSIFQGTAVDGGISANFDIVANHHATKLGDLEPVSAVIESQTEAIATDHRPRMHQYPTTQPNPVIESHLSHQPALVTDLGLFADHAVGSHEDPSPHHRARFHRAMRTDPGIGSNPGTGTNPGGALGLTQAVG